MQRFLFSFILCLLAIAFCGHCDDDVHVIEKKGIVYKFLKADKENESFVLRDFPIWENETFEVFNRFKDDQAIAIDIGAWIGATTIWLSKNFHHVVAIEADKEAIKSISGNLRASECSNVTLCPFPIAEKREEIIFGPRGPRLNDSMSCIKPEVSSPFDYTMKSLTLKQILFETIYSNTALSCRKIGLIKCDIEGGEENILEDILHFAYYNKIPVYMSFHVDWWRSKKVSDFEYLFSYFTTDCPAGDVASFLRFNPFGSVLFQPKIDAGILAKQNLTAVIIAYNQPTYIKNMVSQLEKLTSDIVIIDNNSNSPSLLDYYDNAYNHTLLRMNSNVGHTVYMSDFVQKLVGDIYLLTDPDLEFNPRLPDDCLQNLMAISEHFQSHKVGFSLLIDAEDIRTDISYFGHSIKEWESAFWKNRLLYPANPSLELYEASIDTTFCLINRRFYNPAIRIAGDYTCKHLPWHINFKSQLEAGEYENYLKGNVSTNWFRDNF